jgi:hypothetical protein
LLPFFLGTHEKGLIDFGRGGAARFLFEFFDTPERRLQLSLQHLDDVDQAVYANPFFTHVLFELLDGVHAENLSNRRCASCASFQFSASGQVTILGEPASEI